MICSRLQTNTIRNAFFVNKNVFLKSNYSSIPNGTTNDLPHLVYSAKKPTPISLKMMLAHTGNPPLTAQSLIKTGKWLLDELPIRLAVQVKAIDRMPYGLCLMPSVRRVRKWYIESIKVLHGFPKLRTPEDEAQFAQLLRTLYARHSKTLIAMCKGLAELKRELQNIGDFDIEKDVDVTQYMDDFYMSRIGIRMLAGHFLTLHDQISQPNKDFVGLICTRTSPAQVVQDAIHDARYMCIRTHGAAPEVIFHSTNAKLLFPSVPSYIYYIIFELLKNSMRAVMEKHGNKVSGAPSIYSPSAENKAVPPIRVVVADSKENEDIAIKISDEGGGIPRSAYPKIWSYLYTTAAADVSTLSSIDEPDDFGTQAPLAGLGCGLPLSRLYARYFGGDLQLLSMESYGTDAYIHLPRLADKMEPIL